MKEEEEGEEGDGGGGDADSVSRGRSVEGDMEEGESGVKGMVVVERGRGGGVEGGDEMSSDTGEVNGETSGGDGEEVSSSSVDDR